MHASRSKLRRNKKIFVVALMAFLFAEAGFFLGTTGLGDLILPKAPSSNVSFKDILKVGEIRVVAGNATGLEYPTSYVYIIPGHPSSPNTIATRVALDATERPVYLVTLSTTIPTDIIAGLPQNTGNPVILVIVPLDKANVLNSWLAGIWGNFGVDPQGVVRVSLQNWTPTGAVNI